MTAAILGLDIGGANLKAAHINGAARSIPFALWKHPDRLTEALAELCATMPPHDRLAITMTGELCDCFASKRDGVQSILQGARSLGTALRVWCTRGRFLAFDEAMHDTARVAAANWLALAHFVARRFANDCVALIDAGSTTTDIVYLERGVPRPRGLTDPERMLSGELVYTGVRRTPICAVLGMEVAAELFATMLDAYLLTGLMSEDAADRDTADGRPATRDCAHARLARLRCADGESFSMADAQTLAARALEVQWRNVAAAVERALQDRPVQRVVLSGSGEVLGRRAVTRSQRLAGLPITSLSDELGPALSSAACAYAVACLAAQEETP